MSSFRTFQSYTCCTVLSDANVISMCDLDITPRYALGKFSLLPRLHENSCLLTIVIYLIPNDSPGIVFCNRALFSIKVIFLHNERTK